MRVGILGSGLMGGKLGTIFARAGHEVVFSYARSEQKLKKLAREAKGNAPAGNTRRGRARRRRGIAGRALVAGRRRAETGRRLSGKVVLTCSLPMNHDNTELVVAHTSSGAEELQKNSKGPSSRRIQHRAERSAFRRVRR